MSKADCVIYRSNVSLIVLHVLSSNALINKKNLCSNILVAFSEMSKTRKHMNSVYLCRPLRTSFFNPSWSQN